MKRIRILILLLSITLILFSGTLKASGYENARISLITCTGGSELYSTFGHSALRVVDDSTGVDIVFNFGLFDFNTPNFYLKFMQGRLNYMLGIQNTSEFLWQYSYEGRGVYEQVLNLTSAQKTEIMDRLSYLYLPENRFYLYSFLFKNCTTELRDILKDYIKFEEGYEKKNFRELINEYVKGSKWTRTGINLILGSNLDREISLWEGMFLPDKLFEGIKDFAPDEELLPRDPKSLIKPTPFLLSPLFISFIVCVLLILSRIFKTFGRIQVIALSLFSLLGVALPLIILMTDHIELHANYNLLWCNPLYAFLLAIMPLRRRWSRFLRILIIFLMASSMSVIVVWLNGVQGFLPEYVVLVVSQIIMLGGLRSELKDNSVKL